jgi:fatty acid desaturase
MEGGRNRGISWYRSPVGRDDLKALSQRSDLMGFVQTGGYLAVLLATGGVALYSAGRAPWFVTALLLFPHGMCWAFMINGFHELVHQSVFKTRRLNTFFLRIFSFLGWYNHHFFWASHTEHHKYTLHPPDDLEVVLPVEITLKGFLRHGFINPWLLYYTVKGTIRVARGQLEGEWEQALFPESDPSAKSRLVNWARIVLAGQAGIVAVSLMLGWWMVPVVVTLAPFYGGWLQYLCNNAQHTGLQDNVPDFRLCCRTITLNPVLQFLYWHMNYHTEHHMHATIPCYNLGKLHRLIRADLPPCPNGLWETWRQITAILKRQKQDKSYQYVAALPVRGAAAAH